MPYTYIIGWSKFDKWYYGARYAENCAPSDLWVSYFTSSKYVKEFREQSGEPDVIQIRCISKSIYHIKRCESRVQRILNLRDNPKWLNKHNNGERFSFTGSHSEATKEKIRIALKNRIFTESHLAKISQSRRGQQNTLGYKHRPESIELMRQKAKARHLLKKQASPSLLHDI